MPSPARSTASLLLLAASSCASMDVDRQRPVVQAKLEVARAIGAKVDAAPVEPFRATPSPMQVCAPTGAPPGCDAILVRPRTLRDPAAERGYDTHVLARHDGVLGNAANVLLDGAVVSHDTGPSRADGSPSFVDRRIPQEAKGMRHWFGALVPVRWYLVVRERPGRDTSGASRFGADVLVYDADTGASHGSFPIDAACTNESFVSVRTGEHAGSTSCLGRLVELKLELALKEIGASHVR